MPLNLGRTITCCWMLQRCWFAAMCCLISSAVNGQLPWAMSNFFSEILSPPPVYFFPSLSGVIVIGWISETVLPSFIFPLLFSWAVRTSRKPAIWSAAHQHRRSSGTKEFNSRTGQFYFFRLLSSNSYLSFFTFPSSLNSLHRRTRVREIRWVGRKIVS